MGLTVTAALIPAAAQVNANVAGQTHVPSVMPPGAMGPGAPQMATPTDALAAMAGISSMELMMAGGFHPESAPVIVTPSPVLTSVPTRSTRGRLGGLVPRPSGAVAPGNVASARRALPSLAFPSALMMPGTPDQNAGPPTGPPPGRVLPWQSGQLVPWLRTVLGVK